MKNLLSILLIATAFGSSAAFASDISSENIGPSFDCAIAESDIKTTICESKELSTLDFALHYFYNIGRKIDNKQENFSIMQKKWLNGISYNLSRDIKAEYIKKIDEILSDKKILLAAFQDIISKSADLNKKNLQKGNRDILANFENSILFSYIIDAHLGREKIHDLGKWEDHRDSDGLYQISKDRYIFIYLLDYGSFNIAYKIFLIDYKNKNMSIKALDFPNYDNKTNKIVHNKILMGDLYFDSDLLYFSVYSRDALDGRITKDYKFVLKNDNLELIRQRSTGKNSYMTRYNENADGWIQEYHSDITN